MHLPFTHLQFLTLFGDFNRALWPFVLVLWLLTAVACWRLLRGAHHAGRDMMALLAVQWAWSGAVYHAVFFRRINPAAVLFALLFLLEALLLGWRARHRPLRGVRDGHGWWKAAGLTLMMYALAYPAVGLAVGLRPPAMPLFAVPCPTTLLTTGLLLLMPRREARYLGPIPLLWSIIGGSAAFTLGITPDLALIVAGGALLARIVLPVEAAAQAPR